MVTAISGASHRNQYHSSQKLFFVYFHNRAYVIGLYEAHSVLQIAHTKQQQQPFVSALDVTAHIFIYKRRACNCVKQQ